MSGTDQGRHIPYGPNMLGPVSALLPAPTLQSVHSTQKTWSSALTPERPFYTEDVVLHPHSRASVLHRRRGPAQEPSGPPPFCPAPGSTHLLPTASPRAPPSSSLKSIMHRALKHHPLRCWRVSSVLQGLMPALHGGCDVTPESGYSLEPKLEV